MNNTIDVEFINVGRGHRSWKASLKSLSDERLIREAKSALLSQTVDVIWNESGDGGKIIVGGYRPVGSFKVLNGARVCVYN